VKENIYIKWKKGNTFLKGQRLYGIPGTAMGYQQWVEREYGG